MILSVYYGIIKIGKLTLERSKNVYRTVRTYWVEEKTSIFIVQSDVNVVSYAVFFR